MSSAHEVITFKADKDLVDVLRGVSNRSEFIRKAILSAIDNLCPFCKGAGVLTPHKREHWDQLASKLKEETECDECDELVLSRQKVSK